MITQLSLIKRTSLLSITLLMLIFAFVQLKTLVSVDLTSGFSHPLEGWDHIVTMLGVGIWAAQLRGKAIWLLPLTFVSVMSLGGISGAAQYLAVPSAEILIFLSCLVFSALILRKIHFDIKINVLIVAFFAFFHGYAHGQEISTSASLLSYTIGFMTATLLLHGAGILVTKVILLSITFFIAQLLNFVSPTQVVKINTPSYTQLIQNNLQQTKIQPIRKPPLINHAREWRYLSPPVQFILQFLIFDKTYFVFCVFLNVFCITQFICYVFYIKKRNNFVETFLSATFATCFISSFYLPRFRVKLNFHFFNSNSKGIFMPIRLSKTLSLLKSTGKL